MKSRCTLFWYATQISPYSQPQQVLRFKKNKKHKQERIKYFKLYFKRKNIVLYSDNYFLNQVFLSERLLVGKFLYDVIITYIHQFCSVFPHHQRTLIFIWTCLYGVGFNKCALLVWNNKMGS